MKFSTLTDKQEMEIEVKAQHLAVDLMEHLQHEIANRIGNEPMSTLIQAVCYGHLSSMLLATHLKMMNMANPVAVSDGKLRLICEQITNAAIKTSKNMMLTPYKDIQK